MTVHYTGTVRDGAQGEDVLAKCIRRTRCPIVQDTYVPYRTKKTRKCARARKLPHTRAAELSLTATCHSSAVNVLSFMAHYVWKSLRADMIGQREVVWLLLALVSTGASS